MTTDKIENTTATHKSICKSEAGRYNITNVQASASVPADEFQFGL